MEGLPMNDTRNTDTSTHKKLQMPTATEAEVTDKTDSNGIDRRNFLNCMAWVGTGLIWTMAGGVPKSKLFAATASSAAAKPMHGGVDFSFVQISDSHIGFNKAANQDIAQTLQLAINKINAMPVAGDFMLHTGDITQSAKPSEFDTAHQIIKSVKVNQTFFVPGEHDTATDESRTDSDSARTPLAADRTASRTKGYTSSVSTTFYRSMQWDASAPSSLDGSRTISPRSPPQLPSSSSPTFPCGWATLTGAGARKMVPKLSSISNASAP
jgi:Calcineurin-like phosphoesterase